MARLIFGTIFYNWEHKFNAVALLIIGAFLSCCGSFALMIVGIVSPDSGMFYPIPSVFYGAANGIFWMICS
jgi:hypothetical protein